MKKVPSAIYVGIDGEGQGRLEHVYTLLAVSDEQGLRAQCIENPNGLNTEECLGFILNLPNRFKLFSYSFNYDLTKILVDVDDRILYKLFRSELRQRTGADVMRGPLAVRWRQFRLNLQGTKFTVYCGGRRKVIWDIFRFYSCKFTQALKDWKVGEKSRLDQMSLMKDKRSEFDKEDRDAIRSYCLDECEYMASLARKLVDAHDNVGLHLTGFYGAGSSASAMLKVMGIREQIRPVPPQLAGPVASAFFGGRFENSVIGSIKEPCWNYDISSAYPYQLCFLPCLMHGYWQHTTKRKALDNAYNGLVRYRLNEPKSGTFESWGPFPFRTKDGCISFPRSSGGGWIWREEYLAGERLFPNVQFVEAWVYESDCECQPFNKIPDYYLERIRIGKEGPGIVITLGCNSCYGKLAQSVGQAIFSSWVWAGLITSGTRAQMLDVMRLHKNLSNLLMIATDGIYTLERLKTPKPRDTRTFKLKNGEPNPKPLGGWEEKSVPKGVFVARPGIYFPLSPSIEEIKDVRARGVGKGVILDHWKDIIKHWKEHRTEGTCNVCNVTRFCGAKTSISRMFNKDRDIRKGDIDKWIYNRAPRYGQWITRPVEMSFDPMPKRACVAEDGLHLVMRTMHSEQESVPYDRAMRSQDAVELEQAEVEISEQPDGDLVDYE